MQLLIKILVSIGIILAATEIGKRFPSVAGLIGVMPLTGVLVLVWLYIECNGDPDIMKKFAKGALWGIVPSILFFLVAFICFKKNLPLSVVLLSGFTTWTVAALVHQWMLRF